jgi:hypothetical protein
MPFRLLALPPENRNMIYQHVLVSTHPISLKPDHGPFPHNPSCPSAALERANGKLTNALASSSPSLFPGNIQLTFEAGPIFFGYNTFRFAYLGELVDFLQNLAHRLPLVRHIALEGSEKYEIHSRGPVWLGGTFELLLPATKLETLTLSHGVLHRLSWEAAVAASDFFDQDKEWLRAVGVEKWDDLGALDVIKISEAET